MTRLHTLFASLLQTSPSTGMHIAALDGLRGIALLLVVMSHSSLLQMHLLPGLDMSGTGKLGVWLFFSLSAFLLTLQFLELHRQQRLTLQSWANYALRRFLRIYPLYVAYLLSCWLMPASGFLPALSGLDVLSHLLLLKGDHHLWSIAVEFRYYFLLPVMVGIYLYGLRRSFVAASLATLLVIGVRHWIAPEFDRDGLVTYLTIFMIGSWTALAHHTYVRNPQAGSSHRGMVMDAFALVLFALILLMTPSIWSLAIGESVPLDYWHRSYTLFGTLCGALIFFMLNGAGASRRLFEWKPFRIFGVVSFSGYLWHPAVMTLVSTWSELQSNVRAWLVLALVLALSALSYLLIERPFLRIKLGRPPARREAVAAPVA